jgi:acyl carrier protein
MSRKELLMEYVKEDIARGGAPMLKEDDDLFNAGILDSLGILRMVSFIEEQFGIRVPDEDVVYENFSSIETLSNYLNGLDSDRP